ncbi:uncharacterized protein LOC128216958 [Mya arenaria]|uniref:uncharacterized protein LOC128216958 n=1 Tax=Mya arenaria TaxID=6604 RepID=UPI0022E43655|nr:uncharacterized protein LOC128216958 [Mya arenaria]
MASRGSSIYKGSDLIHDYSCSKCEENDLNTEAQHFCPDCEQYLCDKCEGIHGEYFKKHIVYGRGDIQKWAGFSLDKCEQHGKELEVHCDDHKELCCSVCVALYHRLCGSISHLPDLARDLLKSAEFKQLPGTVDKMRSRLDELKNDRMKDQESLKDSYKNILVEIKDIRKEINKILDQLEMKAIAQLDSMMADLEKSIKDDLESCVYMHDQLRTMIEKLQQTTGKNKETSSYIGFIKCQSKLNEAKCLVQEKRGKVGMQFKSDESVLPFLRNLNNLGNVESFPSMTKSNDTIHVYKTQSSKRYNVKTRKSRTNCVIVGICELPNGDVVIADRGHKTMKLLNRQYEVSDNFGLPASPLHLCYTKGSEIAVAINDSFPITHEIHFLKVTKRKLHTLGKFTTVHECTSVAHHQGQLYVGSDSAIYQYSMDGRLIKKIYEDLEFTVHTCAVSPDGERLYVTKSDSKLITLDKTGQVVSTVEDSDIIDPIGLCVSPSGHVFVCGHGSYTVVQVDQEGTQKLATVASKADGLCQPLSVWFSEQTSTLIVGNYMNDNLTFVKLC